MAGPEDMLAGEYAKLIGSNLLGGELANLRAQAEARSAPGLLQSSDESFLLAFAAVVAEQTRREDFEGFREMLEKHHLIAKDRIPHLARLVAMVVRQIRKRQQKEAFTARSAEGGKAAGKVARIEAEPWQAECAERARQMLTRGESRRNLAGKLAPGFRRSPSQVRRVLKKNGL